MKQIQRIIEYISLLVFSTFIRLLSLQTARKIAILLADFAYRFVPIRKDVVLANLRNAFKGEKTEAELNNIARSTYRQFSQTMMELLFLPKLSGEDLKKMVNIESIQLLKDVLKEGRGAVLVGAHFGNWEFMGAALAQYFPTTFVIGQQENRLVDDLLNSFRTGKGIKLVPLKMALRGVLSTLKKNEFIALLADQDAHEDGVFVDFFGTPASTPKGPAIFALRTGAPLLTAHIFRQDDGTFKAVFELVPRPQPSGSESADIHNYTSAHVKLLEGHTRKYPDHWFWMHRRWKTKQKT